VLADITPLDDEMIFRKTSSNVSTNIDYLLRNLGGRSNDRPMRRERSPRRLRSGYLVTLVPDVCTTTSAARHEQSLIGVRGYCRQRRTGEMLAEIAALTGAP